ncbi:hypothetical protein [Kibdelosporangium phytohabitans]|uniref:Uncharacterized protein n=1 Tax=Kibdelosporangium phytohabitans TaxID=860235 RepID=A0A0N9I1J4_9PSEU|nr:hypothetical protein [Kibdelosporangium phytohabitans]ALG13788.1 hypothetical protein AOZ06_49185 [Kibdelosporangium phytohabitans]MBE1467290.1 fatty acid desaturase [Kibdelosporangium phytohabitans]
MADDTDKTTERKRPDLLTLFAGLAALVMSAYVLTDGQTWLPSFDPRWLLASGAVLVGLLLLGSSLRRHNR